jgi:hypothetical protein
MQKKIMKYMMKIKLTEIQLRRLLEEAISDEIANKYINTEREENINEVLDEVFDSLKQNEEYIKEYEDKNPDRLYFNIPDGYLNNYTKGKDNVRFDFAKIVNLALLKLNNVEGKNVKYILYYDYSKLSENEPKIDFNKLFDSNKVIALVKYKKPLGDGKFEEGEKLNERSLTSVLSNNSQFLNESIKNYLIRFIKEKSLLEKDDLSEEKDLLKYFLKELSLYYDNYGKSSSDIILVISRDKRDITEMTGGRKWSETSCMNCETGGNKRYIHEDIKYGTLIAYAINSDDLNIQKPLARVLVKPFLSHYNPNDIYYKSEKKVYGDIGLINVDFVDSLFNFHNQNKYNFPYKKHEKLYHDSNAEDATITGQNTFEEILIKLSDKPEEFNEYLNKVINEIPKEYIPPIKIIELINKNEIFSSKFKYGFDRLKRLKNKKELYEEELVRFILYAEDKNIEYNYDDYNSIFLSILFKNGIIDIDYLPDDDELLTKFLFFYPRYNVNFINILKNNNLFDEGNEDKLNFYLHKYFICEKTDLDYIFSNRLFLYLNKSNFYNIITEFFNPFGIIGYGSALDFMNQYLDEKINSNLVIFLINNSIKNNEDRNIKAFLTNRKFLEIVKNNKELINLIEENFSDNEEIINKIK